MENKTQKFETRYGTLVFNSNTVAHYNRQGLCLSSIPGVGSIVRHGVYFALHLLSNNFLIVTGDLDVSHIFSFQPHQDVRFSFMEYDRVTFSMNYYYVTFNYNGDVVGKVPY